jgi:hypothetical protein
MVTIFGRKIEIVWLVYSAFFAVWLIWKGILWFSIVAFAPSLVLEYYLKKAGFPAVLRVVVFVVVLFFWTAIFNRLRAGVAGN